MCDLTYVQWRDLEHQDQDLKVKRCDNRDSLTDDLMFLSIRNFNKSSKPCTSITDFLKCDVVMLPSMWRGVAVRMSWVRRPHDVVTTRSVSTPRHGPANLEWGAGEECWIVHSSVITTWWGSTDWYQWSSGAVSGRHFTLWSPYMWANNCYDGNCGQSYYLSQLSVSHTNILNVHQIQIECHSRLVVLVFLVAMLQKQL